MADTETKVECSSDSAKGLKEKKTVEEAENGKDAATNGKNEENGPELDEDEVDEEEEEEEEEDGEGEDEEDEDEDDEDEVVSGQKRAGGSDHEEDDEEEELQTKKQKTDDN
ncbi:prothymosin alpha-B-like isoform X1 [Thalassophryne amazonica]|uniref:prothymosin alpha-B-like isoform X1 n=1 Tax=Thalassophryne amazonica TaxID=390379 RepID=UPI00147146C0|nr:prothymosin alpha-B-like isoform X1 [Thalassophryne amazonica]